MTTNICFAEMDQIILVFVNNSLEQTGCPYHLILKEYKFYC